MREDFLDVRAALGLVADFGAATKDLADRAEGLDEWLAKQ